MSVFSAQMDDDDIRRLEEALVHLGKVELEITMLLNWIRAAKDDAEAEEVPA